MKKKPTISLIRGNTPTPKIVKKPSPCWRCSETLPKNDKIFEVPGATQCDTQGRYYKAKGKQYCSKCMRDNILRTEKELDELKTKLNNVNEKAISNIA